MKVLLNKLLVLFVITHSQSKQTVEVDNINGVDTNECLNGTKPCQSLDYIFSSSMNMNFTVLKLLRGTYPLAADVHISDLVSFEIMSSDGALLHCVNSSAGLTFASSKNITVRGVNIKNCGAKHNNKRNKDCHSSCAFCFTHCKDIFLSNVVFQENNGVALVLFNVGGSVKIINSTFESNVNLLPEANISSGGGIRVEFKKCGSFNSINCTIHDPLIIQDTNYLIKGCNFSSNSGVSTLTLSDVSNKTAYTPYARGAGLSIVSFGNAKRNVFNITDSVFVNNTALWGGGLFVSFGDESENNLVSITGCLFKTNRAFFAGGGVRVESHFKESDDLKLITAGNLIKFVNSSFYRNFAIWGGGVSIKGTTRVLYTNNDSARNITFEKCIFEENFATVGFAIGLLTENLNKDIVGPGMSYRVVINSCSFNRNQMTLTEDKKAIGQGCIYAKEVTLVLIANNAFMYNTGTAIVLDSSSLTFADSSSSVFQNNSGTDGGAIAMYGSSWIELEKDSNLLFDQNSALRKGGAIYVKQSGPLRVAFQTTELQSSSCFIRYKDSKLEPFKWPVNVTFRQNSAPPGTGNSIYTSTLQFCRSAGESRVNPTALMWPFIKYEGSSIYPEIATNPIYLNFNKDQWNVSPYLPFSPDVILLDERNQSVYGSVKIKITSNHGVDLDPPNYSFYVHNQIAGLKLMGKALSNFSVELITNSDQLVVSPSYNVSLNPCLPGFRQIGKKCVCMDAEVGDVIQCLENGTIYTLRGKWGYVSNVSGVFKTIVCPKSYCKCHRGFEDYLCQFNEQEQCSYNREGRLCSQCPQNFSTVLFSEECKICSNISLLISLPILVMLYVVVLILLHFNVNAFSGYLNAFFYCYQMIGSIIPIYIQLAQPISFLIGIFSLSGTGNTFGLCFFNGMDNLTKLGFNYLPPIFFILIAFIFGVWVPQSVWIKLFCRKSDTSLNEYQRNLNRRASYGRAISFVLVVTFSQIITVTLKLLHPVIIDDKFYVFEAAYAEYFHHPEHIFLGTVALCFLVLIIIFFVLLIFTPKFSASPKVAILLPVFEALKSCFNQSKITGNSFQEKQMENESYYQRMFAAFYFVCRVIMLLISIVIQEEVTKLIFLSLACVAFLTVFAIFQPYREKSFNYWDISILSLMCVISMLSLILSVPFTTSADVRSGIEVFLQIVVWYPLLSVIYRLISWKYCRTNEYTYTSRDYFDGGRYFCFTSVLFQNSYVSYSFQLSFNDCFR